ncbi:arginase family protein [Pseudoroseicyclus aestuarii]|uniref:Agmatinase n=1 Tax=Pseudoroseicyclus aestuarii TaxID=1795041 RepID=A0A318SRH6_9RHOB|nr:arginase family protein [Pseudoroseicyclus aestuarii]PYE84420.1 agmatinase [Pseudoroseicyclus aestuarii]
MAAGTLGRMFGATQTGTFLGLPAARAEALEGARVAILGADTATPYPSVGAYCAGGPAAIRAGSGDLAANRGHVNFDHGALALPEGSAVDCGDIPLAQDPAETRMRIAEAIEAVARAGAVPVLLGGDDSIPIPVIEALGRASPEPLWIVQIDAHIDWRDEVEGERYGLSSTIRRASEMAHVEGIIQIGQRGIGSARMSDAEDARAWGATLVSGRAMAGGADPLATLPEGARVCVVFDCDALDPSIMPAIVARTAGGLGYWQAVDLVERIAARGRIAGLTMAEFMPERDIDGLGAATAAQLLTSWLGVLTRA